MRGESARPGKRPLRALSAAEKMDAIQRVHEGESKASVARDIGVPESTLRGWCKSEHKIRGMARNSCTPDSEAHSPASASVTANNSLLAATSEDEACSGKRPKLELEGGVTSTHSLLESLENEQNKLDAHQKIDYAALMASMATMRPEGGSLLLQQFGLLSGATTSSLGKNLLQSAAASQSSAVGLVENGLRYTRSNKRHSSSAVAPTQLDSVAKSTSRNSLPAAAEAPSTPTPASPRKTNDTIQNLSKKENNSSGNKVDEALWLWLTQQQQLLGQQSAMFNPGSNQDGGSWFWKWYKQYGFAPAAPTPAVTKKSPSKTRALLDNVLSSSNNNNNNDENLKRSSSIDQTDSSDVPPSTEEALAHGEKFLKWLEKCSEPSVSRMQIMQFRYLLDNLKTCRKPASSLKRSRK